MCAVLSMLNPVCNVYIHIHTQPFRLCYLQECQAPFGTGSFYDHEGLPYCETHYHAKKGSLCARWWSRPYRDDDDGDGDGDDGGGGDDDDNNNNDDDNNNVVVMVMITTTMMMITTTMMMNYL